ncbi:acylneuraminate cytidylyltransferase family protein, partial [Nostoc sp.]|uniref:acylneuraminate cytidylyltransferase family protein n=1 Tax=Nostoc sp. TaxID=1180 RepID=UPI002FF63E9B
MIHGKKVLAIIPARGGSKAVPRKNIREIGGKPLIAWTIEEAKKSQYIDRLILSSEDDEIISIAQKWGCEIAFKRPVELAQDDTPGIAPVLHALNQLPIYDYVVLLQPTSPLRQVIDIDGCI